MRLERYDVHLTGDNNGAYVKVEDLEKFLERIDKECRPGGPREDHCAYVMGGELEDLLDGRDM